jgi:hypothetical protein
MESVLIVGFTTITKMDFCTTTSCSSLLESRGSDEKTSQAKLMKFKHLAWLFSFIQVRIRK